MRFARSPFMLAFAAAMIVTSAHAGESTGSFADAQKAARERGVPILVDFFTDWCVYCKHFDRDKANPETGIEAALAQVVFHSTDAEKGEGIELAKKFGVRGFPTYALLNADGELIESWAGYGGPSHFLPAFTTALADPTTYAQKQQRFAAHPTAADAQTLARIADTGGRSAEALTLLRRARELDPSVDVSEPMLYAAFGRMRTDQEFGFAGFGAVAREEAMAENATTSTIVLAARLMMDFGPRFGEPDAGLPLLERAVAAIARDPEGVDASTRAEIEIAGLLKLEKDFDAAVAAKRKSLPEGWQQSASSLNAFAWWCFENNVNLEEAELLARKGVELATPGKERAMILDTVAEICNARGNCRDAVTLIEQALAASPGDKHYQAQLERFQKILAGGE
jgi:thioredoxin-related protein